jgi:hypothetical protein
LVFLRFTFWMRLEPARAKGIGSETEQHGMKSRVDDCRKRVLLHDPPAGNSGDKYPPALQSQNPVVGCAIRRPV